MYIHGGDIYRNKVEKDFSVSINPYEWTDELRADIVRVMQDESLIYTYPDALNARLTDEAASYEDTIAELVVCAGGASELISAVCMLQRDSAVLLQAPCYMGYERAIRAAGAEVMYCYPDGRSGFFSLSPLIGVLKTGDEHGIEGALGKKKDVGMVIVTNPSNPTGALANPDELREIVCLCRDKDIVLAVDESFMELVMSHEEYDAVYGRILRETTGKVIRLKSMTKSYRIPGLRLGYAVCSHKETAGRIRDILPEWNISGPATEAGIACLKDRSDYLKRSREYIKSERAGLSYGLKELGLKVYEGDANYILIYSDLPLYEKLLDRGMLIRDCETIEGLKHGFYRLSLRHSEDDYALMSSIKDIITECGGIDGRR